MAKTASGLVAYCKAQLGLPYWYGTFGNTASEDLYNYKRQQYPAYYTATDFISQYGKRVHDCVGLVKGYRWSDTPTSAPKYNASQDVAVGGLFRQCSETGSISTMPDQPGVCVFMSDMSHVGVYVGGGYVIEARGHAYGVVKTKLTERSWGKWGKLSWLTYDTNEGETNMAKKIFLSPSNQTSNTYAAGGTNEAVVCGMIGVACKAALERCGFSVKMMQYDTMQNRVAAGNAWGADLYIPIHTNAHNGKTTGTRLFYYNTASEGYKACKAIFNVLAPLTPGTSEGISAYPGLYEVKNPDAPTVYVEVDFHDVPAIAEWIIENTEAIGEAICEGICKHYGVTYNGPKTEKTEVKPENANEYYRVQLGAFSVRENAEALAKKLEALGYDTYITKY